MERGGILEPGQSGIQGALRTAELMGSTAIRPGDSHHCRRAGAQVQDSGSIGTDIHSHEIAVGIRVCDTDSRDGHLRVLGGGHSGRIGEDWVVIHGSGCDRERRRDVSTGTPRPCVPVVVDFGRDVVRANAVQRGVVHHVLEDGVELRLGPADLHVGRLVHAVHQGGAVQRGDPDDPATPRPCRLQGKGHLPGGYIDVVERDAVGSGPVQPVRWILDARPRWGDMGPHGVIVDGTHGDGQLAVGGLHVAGTCVSIVGHVHADGGGAGVVGRRGVHKSLEDHIDV
mmetsp:Transcript_53175/g.94927  ORF Transcript_53175/g.94927 Transcript_53175/m.94927 type:complete len:284 (+) Transcript_53175:9642-10493(+)